MRTTQGPFPMETTWAGGGKTTGEGLRTVLQQAAEAERLTLWRLGPFGNPALIGAVALTVALQIMLTVVPFLRDVFDLEMLAPGHWLLAVGLALAYGVAVELDKWVGNLARSDHQTAAAQAS